MNDLSIGAIGAATIAGLVSLLGLIIAKEQKISEFRQAWIDELRKAIVAYLVNINAIADMVSLKSSGQTVSNDTLIACYKSLNEASHGIRLRVNDNEKASKDLLEAMRSFEAAASSNSTLNPSIIKDAEAKFIPVATELLKFEWNRVKRGETIFVHTKRLVMAAILFLMIILAINWHRGAPVPVGPPAKPWLQPAELASAPITLAIE